MLLDLSSMRSRAMGLLKNGKDYNTLLAAITEKDYYYDDSLKLPSLKELAEYTGLKYDVVRRQLRQIYEDLLPHDENGTPFYFNKVKYVFYLDGYKNKLSVDVDTLPVTPRIGENITIPFFKAYVGTDYFYVADIRHILQDNLQIIDIHLKTGTYNLCWHYQKDKALEEGEIGLHDLIYSSDYALKKKLKIGR